MSDDVARLTSAVADRYQIEREIGRGGMATVYLARDIRHNRNVALKLLNAELGAVLGVERFLAEIRVTANLQHPNILPLFDSGEANGLLYYVMPYIEGETLRTRLDHERQLPVAEAVSLSSTIANALGYAHRHNVIHRDLKPENILLHEDQPLIADFGIALAVSNAGGNRVTQTGLSLGTPQYMSPEQATGDRVIDARSDIYSLGAMTYEMLTGDPPHVGSTSQAVIAKLLTEKPASIRASRPSVPANVDSAVGRALEKLAADRFVTAKEFADAIQGKTTVEASTAYSPTAVGSPAKRSIATREIAAWAAAALFGILAAFSLKRPKTADEAPTIRTTLDLPPNVRIADQMTGTTVALSPKGDMIAYTVTDVSGFHVMVRRFDQADAREISSRSGRNLTFSPDGKWIAFSEGNVLFKSSVDGDQTLTLGSTGGDVPYGITWGKSGQIFVGSFGGMYQLAAGGGNPVMVTRSSAKELRTGVRFPTLSPDEKAILYSSESNASAQPKLGVISVGDWKRTEFDIPVSVPLGIIDGQLVYVAPKGDLMTVPFDVSAHRPSGDPVQMDEGILVDGQNGSKASLSPSGTLVFLRGHTEYQMGMISPGTDSVHFISTEPANYLTPRFSPNGKRIAVTLYGSQSTDIWVYDISRNIFTRVTSGGINFLPEWSPDGRDIVFMSSQSGKTWIYRQHADGSAPAELVFEPPVEPFEAGISPDNKWLIIRTAPDAKYPRDILGFPLSGDRVDGKPDPTLFVAGPDAESMPRISPNGRWMAYASNEKGHFEVYVRPFPGNGARIQVTDGGATEPVWGRDGQSLYYRAPGKIGEVKVTTGDTFSIGQKKEVLDDPYLRYPTHANYDVAPDGRFLVLKRSGPEAKTVIIHNWAAMLKKKAATH